jgi:hypothetical protein
MSAGEEARKKLLRKKKVEQAMEAAFDDDLKTLRKVIEEVKDGIDVPIDPVLSQSGQKQDSFLGEAACGNAKECVEYLLSKGADVNWVGINNRTPLQRALHNSAAEVVPLLLEAGADMRLLFPQERDADGNIVFREWDPNDLNSLDCEADIIEQLKKWDFGKTLKLLAQKSANAENQAAAKADEDQKKAAEFKSAADVLKEEHDAVLEQYKAAILLREERIKEYDRSKCEGRLQVLDVAEGLIKQAEKQVEETKTKLSVLQQKLKSSEAKLREHQVAMQGGIKYDAEIGIAQLEDVIFADVGDHIQKSGRPVPLVIDPTGNGLTFLTYRNALLVDIANSHHMHPKQMLLNILGCLRFGKPLVVNLRDKTLQDALTTLKTKCEGAHAGLYDLLISKEVRHPQNYEKLITPEVEAENHELNKKRFTPVFTEKFVVAFLSQQPFPVEEDMKPFYTVFVSV